MTKDYQEVERKLDALIQLVKKTEGYLYANKQHPSVSGGVAVDNLSEQVNIKYRQFKEALTTYGNSLYSDGYKDGFKQGKFDKEMDNLNLNK